MFPRVIYNLLDWDNFALKIYEAKTRQVKVVFKEVNIFQ